MTIPDTIYDTINNNWGAGGYAGAAPAIDTTETQTSSDVVTANVIEVRAHTLRERGDQKNDVYVNRHYTIDVYVSTKTSAAQLTLLYDEVEYLLRNTAMTGIQLEDINKDWSVSEWEEGRHSVVLRVAVVALLSDGAVTSAAGVTASMQALLMYTSANAAWVPCNIYGGTNYNQNWLAILSNASNGEWGFEVPLPTLKGALKLYINGTALVIGDADAANYVTATGVYGILYTGATSLDADTTNKDSIARHEDTFTAVDCSPYNKATLWLSVVSNAANALDVYGVFVRCYYDT